MTELDPNDPNMGAFINILVWYRMPYGARLGFFKEGYSKFITLKETRVSHDRDDYRVFRLTDDEVLNMVLPRII